MLHSSGHTREDNVVARHEQAQQQRGQELQAAAERCVALAYHTLAQLFLSATVVSERSTDRHVSSVRKGDQSNPYEGRWARIWLVPATATCAGKTGRQTAPNVHGVEE